MGVTRHRIYERIDAALEKARWRQLHLRGIYLDEADYFALVRAETARWRKASGSGARVYPMSYDNALIIGGSALVSPAKSSAVYAESGEAITICKHLSPKVRAP